MAKRCLREKSPASVPDFAESVVALKAVGSGSALSHWLSARLDYLNGGTRHQVVYFFLFEQHAAFSCADHEAATSESLPLAHSRSERSICSHISFPMKHPTRGRRGATLTRGVRTERVISRLVKLATEADGRSTRFV